MYNLKSRCSHQKDFEKELLIRFDMKPKLWAELGMTIYTGKSKSYSLDYA